MSKIFQIGIPSSLSMLIISFGQVVMNKILVNYSTEAVAAYQIVSRLDMLLFMPILGIAISLTTIVGMFYGAKEIKKIKFITRYGISRSVMITVTGSILLFLLAPIVVTAFTKEEVIQTIAVGYLRNIAVIFPLIAVGLTIGRISVSYTHLTLPTT